MPSPESLSPHLSSIESLRSSIPEEHRKLFDSLQQDIKDYCASHNLPTPSLTFREAFITAAQKNRTPPDVLNHIILLLKRFDYLTEHKKPIPPEQDPQYREALEYAEEHYYLSEQYASQVSLLERIGILKDGHIEAIDGRRYPVPTIEQIVLRLYERRRELSPKHDQGFTKLLLVPFGMSLDTLLDTLKHFLLTYKQQHSGFELDTDEPLLVWTAGYQGGDTRLNPDGSPVLVYHPTSFDSQGHQGKTKSQILSAQSKNPSSFPGWTVHLLQPSNPKDPNSPGIAPIPRQSKGTSYGQDPLNPLDLSTPSRPDLEAGQTPKKYLSLLQSSHDNPDSPYTHETGLTPEDWILSFMTHLQETGQPLDNHATGTQSTCFLTGAFFPSRVLVPHAYWLRDYQQARLGRHDPSSRYSDSGSRSSVMISGLKVGLGL